MVILIVEHQKSAENTIQDAVSHSIHFGSVQPNPQHYQSTYGISIIETIRSQITQGFIDPESQMHISEVEPAVGGKHDEVIGTPGIEKENISPIQ